MILWRWLLIALFLFISIQASSNDYNDYPEQEEVYIPDEDNYYPEEDYSPQESAEDYSDEY